MNKQSQLEQTLNCVSESQWVNASTDPQHHSEDFRYLVHAIRDESSLAASIHRIELMKIAKVNELAPTVDIVGQAGKLSELFKKKVEKRAFACSYINLENSKLWSDQGLIIKVTSEDSVIATGTSDIGSPIYSLDACIERFNGTCVSSPTELLESSNSSTYNEVVCRGDREYQVLGVIIKVDRFGKPKNEYGKMLELRAKAENLPIIYLKETISRRNLNEIYEKEPRQIYYVAYQNPIEDDCRDVLTIAEVKDFLSKDKEWVISIRTDYSDGTSTSYLEDRTMIHILFGTQKPTNCNLETALSDTDVKNKQKALEIIDNIKVEYPHLFEDPNFKVYGSELSYKDALDIVRSFLES